MLTHPQLAQTPHRQEIVDNRKEIHISENIPDEKCFPGLKENLFISI